MPTNIFEQLDEIYSRWSILDKVGKEMQLERMWQQAMRLIVTSFRCTRAGAI